MANADIGIKDLKQEAVLRILEDSATYRVPYFQREYSWRSDDWTAFYEDLEAVRSSKEGHFFGFMTFRTAVDGDIEIIEGQQRLSTVCIFLAVVRDIYYAVNDLDWKDLDKYINRQPGFKSTDLVTPRLRLSRMNADYFQTFIQKASAPETKLANQKKSKLSVTNQLILGAYKYFYDQLQLASSRLSKDESDGFYSSMVEACTSKLVIVTTYVTDEIVAYNIFQTLNGRGLDLTLTDLLKVYLFEMVGKAKTNVALERWDIIRETLSSVNTNAFLRHFWLSTRSLVQEQKLLTEVKKSVHTGRQALSLLDELKEEAGVYDSLLNPNPEDWSDPEIADLLEELQILSTQQPLPLLLAGQKRFPLSEFKKLIRLCIAFVFRYQTIGELENKEMERLFSGLAIDIRKKSVKNTAEVSERMQALYPRDDAFKAQFLGKTVKARQVAKYILSRIEDHLGGDTEKVAKTITLEHILPLSPDDEWKAYLFSEGMKKDELVHRLGNYTLLTGKVNKAAQSKFFTKKRDENYKNSNLKINTSLQTIKSWTEKDIAHRQSWLASIALRIWKI
ncbi:MAG: DUF262 domain-containing HNH endonuclease family protein [Bacteroidota bacterium]|nr:DUF262 domain-containing HNH endonuclease family protein [Bacteroidota bacterium]MDP4234552.1 DUF262 domain-containing HNH endonuclease family protein [Bacteroidota bacterium]MDP4243681.1 DUF262 domain-containing HNH endonuclease family protein [Bacteroidota bacterium]MDP4288371.1 DUF262 domain-containing HNH endonuclease family protein [Bacteroidota bacterium]